MGYFDASYSRHPVGRNPTRIIQSRAFNGADYSFRAPRMAAKRTDRSAKALTTCTV
jgi:hypothetical protein